MSKVENLTVTELKTKLVAAAKETSKTMAPMLFYLRKRIKAQGKAGQGFGQWVEVNLGITRRTADRWADDWAIVNGLKKPASGQKSKGDGGGRVVDGVQKEYFTLNLLLTKADQCDLIFAWEKLGEEEATQLLLDALVEAAKAKEPRTDTFKLPLGELETLDVVPPAQTVPGMSSRSTSSAEGEPL
jgi:hypothetical protein